jgi:hypothetical protein
MIDLLNSFADSFVALSVTHNSGAFVGGVYTVTTSYTTTIHAVTPQALTQREIDMLPMEQGESIREALKSWVRGRPVALGNLVAYDGRTYRVMKEQYRAEEDFQEFTFADVAAP